MNRRLLVLVPVLAMVLSAAACSSDDSASDATTTTAKATTSSVVGNVLPPVILSPEKTSATVKPGTTVTFDMGDPGQGRFVATSDNDKVFVVTGEGKVDGSATFNAGGKAVSAGTAQVTVQFMGSTNGVGTPTTFTITVE